MASQFFANRTPEIYGLYGNIAEIPFATWKESGIEVPLLDKDNTITNYRDPELLEQVVAGLKKAAFPDIYPAIGLVSNSRATEAVYMCGKALQGALGIEVEVVTRADGPFPRKPHPKMGVVAARRLGATRGEQVGVIGDRRFTDVAFAGRLGAGAVGLCDKVGHGEEEWVGRLHLRRIEKFVVAAELGLGMAQDFRPPKSSFHLTT